MPFFGVVEVVAFGVWIPNDASFVVGLMRPSAMEKSSVANGCPISFDLDGVMPNPVAARGKFGGVGGEIWEVPAQKSIPSESAQSWSSLSRAIFFSLSCLSLAKAARSASSSFLIFLAFR